MCVYNLLKKQHLLCGSYFTLSFLQALFKFNILFFNILLVLIGIIPYPEFTRLNNIIHTHTHTHIHIYIYIHIVINRLFRCITTLQYGLTRRTLGANKRTTSAREL